MSSLIVYVVAPLAILYLLYRRRKNGNDAEQAKWVERYFDGFDFNHQSVEIDEVERIRVNTLSAEPAKKMYEECNTPFKALVLGLQRSKNGDCLGWRDGSSDYKWINFSELIENVKYFGSALSQKLPLSTSKEAGDTIVPVGFYLANKPECTISQFGCVCYGYTILPFYDTYGIDSIKGLIKLASVKAIITDTDKRIENILKDFDREKLGSIRFIIYTNKEKPNKALVELASANNIELVRYSDLIELGKMNLIQPNMNSSDESIYAIVPTSGTSGEPKAAILTHRAAMFFSASFNSTISNYGAPFRPGDIFFSYLPNAHVFDLMSMVSLMSHGVSVGYSRGDVKLLLEDMQALRPTILPMVARMLQKVHDKVMNGIREKGFIFQYLLKMAIESKIKERERGIIRHDTIWDKIIFNKIKALLGGRVRAMCCGAAPFPKDITRFARAVFSCYIFEGYGQTESTSATTVSHPLDPNYEHVGAPILCLETKLVDVPEMDYHAKDNKGEICIRGPTIFSGYYKNEEKTKEAIDEQGWLHTGDVGTWLPNGALKIIDRKKQIFKLSQGEYVAPEKIENILRRSQFIDQVYVEGNSLHHFIVAVIVLEPENLKKWAQDNKIEFNFKDLCTNNTKLKSEVLKDLVRVSRENKLNGYEVVKDIHIHDEVFSVENGLLTPTQKIKRIALKKHFQQVFDKLYSTNE